MNQQDFAQIKHRLNPEKRNPSAVRGCYISSEGEIISEFSLNVGTMTEEENEKYMGIFKRVITGTQGQNIVPVDFSPDEMEEREYQLLSHLRSSRLRDDDVAEALWISCQEMVKSMKAGAPASVDETAKACNYLMLVMFDGYDIPARDVNGEIDRERSSNVFSYIIGALCPVKRDKPELCHDSQTGEFHLHTSEWTVLAPEKGFLFPAYEEGGANIYRGMCYSKKTDAANDAFLQTFFGERDIISASEQMATMQQIMQESLKEDCKMEVVQDIHDSVKEIIDEKKADKKAEAPKLTKENMQEILMQSGVSSEKVEEFGNKYDEAFGENTAIPAINIAPVREFKVNTPDVTIKVNPNRSDLIETRIIDGKRYILVLADGDVEVNGMRVTE